MPICSTMRFNAISVLSFLVSSIEARARVRSGINGEKALGLDLSVSLRRREAGVTQQLLDRAKIAAGAQEVSRKTVPQGMRGRGLRKTEVPAQQLHLTLHKARVEGAAASTDKERILPGQRVRAGGQIVGDR